MTIVTIPKKELKMVVEESVREALTQEFMRFRALLLPLIAVIPLAESLSVIIQLFSKKFFKRKVFLSTPIHHTFEALGWPETQITMRFWMINAIGAIIGLILFLIDSKIPPLLK